MYPRKRAHIYVQEKCGDGETKTDRIRRKLEKDGWYLARHGSGHDIYRHLSIKGIITLPRHKTVSLGVARSVAKKAGWPE